MVVNRLKDIVPKYTDDFSTILSVSSLTRSGTTITCTTSTAHGLTTGNYATIRGAKEPIALVGITFLDGIATATAASDHLLSDPAKFTSKQYIEIAGATGFNGTWELVSVPSSLIFTFKISGSPANVSGGFLLLEDFDGYNGYKQVSVVSPTSFTYQTTGSMQSPAQGSIQASCLCRVEESATPARIQEFYSEEVLEPWMFVVFGQNQAFKHGSVVGDSSSAKKVNEDYWSEMQQQFSIYIVLPAADSILAGDIAQRARSYRILLLKCLANYVFVSDLKEEETQPCQFIGDEADDYIKATYTHRFDFTYQSVIQMDDTAQFSNGRPLKSIDGLFDNGLEFNLITRP